ncbi:hypothetical protein M1O57_02405 [Dehalococcoidia bacterium]|nr:hypothetical protein [Dehalococcoidia bacterium]MCL0104433.1 hypothetical protein [Dehalococcoidia bacterium]
MRNQRVVISVVLGIVVIVLLGLSGVIPFPVTLTGEAPPMTNEELLALFWDPEVTFTEFLRELGRTHPVAATYLEERIEEWAPLVAYSPEEFKLKFKDLVIWPNIGGDGRTSVTFAEYWEQFVENFPVAAAFLNEWALNFVDYSPEELESVRRFRSQVAGGRMAVVNAVLARLWGMEVTLVEVLDQVARIDPLAAAHWSEVITRLLRHSPEELEVEWRGRPEDGISGINMRPRRVSPEGEDR